MAENNTDKTEAKSDVGGKAGSGTRCQIEKCKHTVRAKGYCRKHFLGWRRGKLGAKFRYKICSKEGCRKKATAHGRCDEHQKNAKAGEGAAA